MEQSFSVAPEATEQFFAAAPGAVEKIFTTAHRAIEQPKEDPRTILVNAFSRLKTLNDQAKA